MATQAVGPIRHPAVAGTFYPGEADALRAALARCFDDSRVAPDAAAGGVPKALIVPHAGYAYSGPVAASAYALLRAAPDAIRRVVLLGPSHFVAFAGLALPRAGAMETPLGVLVIDRSARAALAGVDEVVTSDRPHEFEHSLEVQLPFLQSVLVDFKLVPLAAGEADPEAVARMLDSVWGGPETLLVLSTDLSHYHEYSAAQRLDAATARSIMALSPRLEAEQACGCTGLNGLLLAAQWRGMSIEQLDVRSSGDTAGDRSRVVGYGAFALYG